MSKSYFVGLSESQVQRLLAEHEVMKRHYWNSTKYNKRKKYQYDDRVFIRMLTKEEEAKEPKTAFEN